MHTCWRRGRTVGSMSRTECLALLTRATMSAASLVAPSLLSFLHRSSVPSSSTMKKPSTPFCPLMRSMVSSTSVWRRAGRGSSVRILHATISHRLPHHCVCCEACVCERQHREETSAGLGCEVPNEVLAPAPSGVVVDWGGWPLYFAARRGAARQAAWQGGKRCTGTSRRLCSDSVFRFCGRVTLLPGSRRWGPAQRQPSNCPARWLRRCTPAESGAKYHTPEVSPPPHSPDSAVFPTGTTKQVRRGRIQREHGQAAQVSAGIGNGWPPCRTNTARGGMKPITHGLLERWRRGRLLAPCHWNAPLKTPLRGSWSAAEQVDEVSQSNCHKAQAEIKLYQASRAVHPGLRSNSPPALEQSQCLPAQQVAEIGAWPWPVPGRVDMARAPNLEECRFWWCLG